MASATSTTEWSGDNLLVGPGLLLHLFLAAWSVMKQGLPCPTFLELHQLQEAHGLGFSCIFRALSGSCGITSVLALPKLRLGCQTRGMHHQRILAKNTVWRQSTLLLQMGATLPLRLPLKCLSSTFCAQDLQLFQKGFALSSLVPSPTCPQRLLPQTQTSPPGA